MKIVVLASGSGTNFENLAKHVKIDALICNKPTANCINIAKAYNIQSFIIQDNDALRNKLKDINPDLICLAGYMRLIPSDIVDYFENKIINIHPSLLPKHPGLHAFERSFEEDETLGVTVHYVDSGMDTGNIIQQATFKNTGNLETSLQLLKENEHKLYLNVVRKIIEEYDEKKSID